MTEIAGTETPVPLAPLVRFDTSPESLRHNTQLLASLNFDFEEFMAQNQNTTIGYNSEFRPVAQTEKVFGKHPHFEFVRSIAEGGMDYRVSETLTETERQSELDVVLKRGNHKSAEAELPTAVRLLGKDVRHGFSLPFLREAVRLIPDAEVQPCGLAKQFTLNADGPRVMKDRLTQDLSFWSQSRNQSVNTRVDLPMYPDMVYGWCLLRIIHFVVAL
jgi:hypothetical protein